MTAYIILMLVLAALVGVYAYFLIRRIIRFYVPNIKKVPLRILNIGLTAAVVFSSVNMLDMRAVVVLHVLAMYLVLDLAALAARLPGKDRQRGKVYLVWRKVHGCGLVPVVAACAIIAYGFFNMNHAVRTEYSVMTEKRVGDYQVILITDIHYDTVQDTELLKGKIEEINARNPDIVVLGGDIVEEGTTKEMMQEAFEVLGGLESRYGVYYVYGNHDSQPYTDYRSFTDEELEKAILSNGIIILEDSYIEINDDLILAGRGDVWGNASGRLSTKEILEGADRDRYIILADHQPVGVDENSAEGVDLQLSGHTHAGQIWPAGWLTEIFGSYNYGEYQKGNCRLIVSSGFAGWRYPVRTGEHCEYVVVTIQGMT